MSIAIRATVTDVEQLVALCNFAKGQENNNIACDIRIDFLPNDEMKKEKRRFSERFWWLPIPIAGVSIIISLSSILSQLLR